VPVQGCIKLCLLSLRGTSGERTEETNKNVPPLPNPLLHPMEEREKSRSLMQPWCPFRRAFFGWIAVWITR
jgi:hypothetical protein